MNKNSWQKRDTLILMQLICVAFIARVYHIGQQSLWQDEYHSIILDRATPLSDFWSVIWHESPDHVPLYYLITFAWAKLAGAAIVTQRLLSVAGSCATLLPIYAIGRRYAGRDAAIASSAFFAIAQTQVWYGQSLRAYYLLVLFGALSVWTLLHALEGGGRKWWLLNWLVNLFVVSLHITGVFLLLAEGLCLVWTRRWTRTFLWGTASAATLLPWIVLVRSSGITELALQPLPSLGTFVSMTLGGNLLTLQLPVWAGPWVETLRGAGAQYYVWAMDLLTGGALLLALGLGARRIMRMHPGGIVFPLLVVAPALAALAISYSVAPLAHARHTIVSVVGVTVLFGAGVAAPGKRWQRAALALCVLGPMALQTFVGVNSVTRPDMQAVGHTLHDTLRLSPSQVVIVDNGAASDGIMPLLLAAYMGFPVTNIGDAQHLPAGPAESLRVVHTLQAALDLCGGLHGWPQLPERFAIVATPDSVRDRGLALEARLQDLGYRVSRLHSVSFYVWDCKRATTATPAQPLPPFADLDASAFFKRVGFVPESEADAARAESALRCAYDPNPERTDDADFWLLLPVYLAENHPALAGAVLRHVVEKFGDVPAARVARALVETARGDTAAARDTIANCLALNDRSIGHFYPMLRALAAGDSPGYQAALADYARRRHMMMPLLRRIADIPELGPVRADQFN